MLRPLSRDVAIAAFVVLTVVAIVSFAPLPQASRLSGDSHDFAHVLVFGVLGLFVARALRRIPGAPMQRLRVIGFTLALGLVLGIGTELAQRYTGGTASFGDVLRDLLGTALGLCVAFALERATARTPRRLLWSIALLGLVAAAVPLAGTLRDYRARATLFPVLFDPAAARGLAFVRSYDGPVEVTPLPTGITGTDDATPAAVPIPATAPDGPPLALRLKLDRGPWPGATLTEPAADWRGHGRLVIELANPDPQPLVLGIRVNDRAHDHRYDDRFNAEVELPPRTRRRLKYAIEAIEAAPRGRRMNLAAIDKLTIFHDGPLPGREFLLLHIALERP